MCRQSLHHIFHGLVKSPIASKHVPAEEPAGENKPNKQSEGQIFSPPQLAKGLLSPAGALSSKRRRVLASPSIGYGRRVMPTPVKQSEAGREFGKAYQKGRI